VQVRQIEALADGITDAAVLVRYESQRPPLQQSLAWSQRQWAKVERGIGELDRIAAGREWLCGNAISLADIAAACMYAWMDFRYPYYDIGPKHPSLEQWVAPLLARPSFTQTEPQN
jgi:glutathione S-transferase